MPELMSGRGHSLVFGGDDEVWGRFEGRMAVLRGIIWRLTPDEPRFTLFEDNRRGKRNATKTPGTRAGDRAGKGVLTNKKDRSGAGTIQIKEVCRWQELKKALR